MQANRRGEREKGRGGEEDSSFILHPSSFARREWLQRSLLAGAGAGLAVLGGTGCDDIRNQVRAVTGPTPANYVPLPQDGGALQMAVHAVNRVAFGPRPGDIARIVGMSAKQPIQAWVEE